MKYILDTNIISEFQKQVANDNVVRKAKSNKNESVIASVTWYELLRGLKRMPDGKRKEYIRNYLFVDVAEFYEILPYDKRCAELQSSISAKLESVGLPAPYQDTQIAAVALANDLILVTRNVKDFSAVQEYFPLKIENWFEN